jgi:16S rRNA (uracil1498-N3)-methyltransferase
MRPRILFPNLIEGPCDLDPAASHHLGAVLRVQAGQEVTLFNGQGQEATARVVRVSPGAVTVQVGSLLTISREAAQQTILIQALCGGDKMDWVIEKATELGVHQIIPVAAQRSILKLSGDRAAKRLVHWQRIAQAASAQCGRNLVPEIFPITTLPRALTTWSGQPLPKTGWLLDPFAALSLSQAPLSGALTIMIGPEAGWSDEEEALAKAAGATGVRCGPRVLRTETAALTVLAAVATRSGEF